MLIMLNCHNRRHAELYDRYDAFFDLDLDRHEAEREMLYAKATCCVLSYADVNNKSGNLLLAYWHYEDEFEDADEHACVLVGNKIGEVTLPKSQLATLPEFAGVIARDGDFNQFTVKSSSK